MPLNPNFRPEGTLRPTRWLRRGRLGRNLSARLGRAAADIGWLDKLDANYSGIGG